MGKWRRCVFAMVTNPVAVWVLRLASIIPFQHGRSGWLTQSLSGQWSAGSASEHLRYMKTYCLSGIKISVLTAAVFRQKVSVSVFTEQAVSRLFSTAAIKITDNKEQLASVELLSCWSHFNNTLKACYVPNSKVIVHKPLGQYSQ